MAIRIFIYDDSQQRRNSLKALFDLNEHLIFVGEAENCKHALQEMQDYHPDIVLMDINMPEVDGIQGLKIIKTNYPNIQVLIQTAFDDSDKIFTCIKYGASGYILKSDNANKIEQAIQEIFDGGVVMNPIIARKVIEYFSPINPQNLLTRKENIVLKHLANGLNYKMIASELCVSYSTVNHHIKNIYAKLHISSLGEAIAYYYKNLYK